MAALGLVDASESVINSPAGRATRAEILGDSDDDDLSEDDDNAAMPPHAPPDGAGEEVHGDAEPAVAAAVPPPESAHHAVRDVVSRGQVTYHSTTTMHAVADAAHRSRNHREHLKSEVVYTENHGTAGACR